LIKTGCDKIHKEIYAIAKHYGDSCKDCKEVCCANMALDITRNEQKRMAKKLEMDILDFRKKYTILFKSMFKGEMKLYSEEAKRQMQKNPRLLKFIEKSMKESKISDEQKDRLVEWAKEAKTKEEKITILLCPFYNTETHECTIHEARPEACYLYPFNYGYNKQIDLRKMNACILSTKFLERMKDFLKRMGQDKSVSYLEEVLEKKEYHNHFYVPVQVVYSYILWECEKLKIKVTSPDLVKMRKIIILGGIANGNI